MAYRMSLRFHVDEDRGLCLTVRRTKTTEDEEGERQTVTTEKTDAWLASSIGDAVACLVTEYLDNIDDELKPTPIEEAAGEK